MLNAREENKEGLTFIMRSMVLRTMRVMMKYSKGEETTTLHSLYLKLSLSFGMYLSNGSALQVILKRFLFIIVWS